ncbi:uncharacterized protein LOC121383903 [Gigantopelta aegis]|uniref:uncharacterized protein LOC121383903 n=1 Tax=Gigantopelta aegis TaxID=1735272 RepID=UPI001B88DFB9|nr:uncharacterized protein LOC121383903 [Gigantopelta aegis]
MHNYLDDWLIPASSQTACLEGVELVIDMILQLWFIPNWVKSELVPSQVDLHLQFQLHVLKCSSKTEPPDGRNFYLHRTEGIEQNFKLINEYDCGAPYEMKEHLFLPSVKARRIQIKWKSSSFTLKLDLFGCPSEPFEGKSPQCGTMFSFYHLTENDRAYRCLYFSCPPNDWLVKCGSYPVYYQSSRKCYAQHSCYNHPCNMGEMCVQEKTNHKCYCLKPPCGLQSGIDLMLDKHEVSLLDTIEVYIAIVPNDPTYNYTAEIGDLICKPDFKTFINAKNEEVLCSKFIYKTTKVGTLKAIVKKHRTTQTDTSKSYTLRVTSHEPLINHCLENIQIKGASFKSFDEHLYSTVEHIQFTMFTEIDCSVGDFEIIKYKWTVSCFESETYNFCISDNSFKVLFSSSTNTGILDLKKRPLLGGYFKICLQVDGNHGDRRYSEVNVACGYFRVKTVPLELVIKPPGLHHTVLNTRRLRLDVSDSKDPNSPHNSGLSYEWKCKPVNSSQNVCHFGSRRNMFPYNGSIFIPPNFQSAICNMEQEPAFVGPMDSSPEPLIPTSLGQTPR